MNKKWVIVEVNGVYISRNEKRENRHEAETAIKKKGQQCCPSHTTAIRYTRLNARRQANWTRQVGIRHGRGDRSAIELPTYMCAKWAADRRARALMREYVFYFVWSALIYLVKEGEGEGTYCANVKFDCDDLARDSARRQSPVNGIWNIRPASVSIHRRVSPFSLVSQSATSANFYRLSMFEHSAAKISLSQRIMQIYPKENFFPFCSRTRRISQIYSFHSGKPDLASA